MLYRAICSHLKRKVYTYKATFLIFCLLVGISWLRIRHALHCATLALDGFMKNLPGWPSVLRR